HPQGACSRALRSQPDLRPSHCPRFLSTCARHAGDPEAARSAADSADKSSDRRRGGRTALSRANWRAGQGPYRGHHRGGKSWTLRSSKDIPSVVSQIYTRRTTARTMAASLECLFWEVLPTPRAFWFPLSLWEKGIGVRSGKAVYCPMAGEVTGPLVCVFQMTWPLLASSA